jgi:hypothetical protein
VRIEIDWISAAPVSVTPCGAASSLAVTLSRVPLKVELPMNLIANPKFEWTGSAAYVPLSGVL